MILYIIDCILMLLWLIEIYLVLVYNGYFNYELSNEWNLILEFYIK